MISTLPSSPNAPNKAELCNFCSEGVPLSRFLHEEQTVPHLQKLCHLKSKEAGPGKYLCKALAGTGSKSAMQRKCFEVAHLNKGMETVWACAGWHLCVCRCEKIRWCERCFHVGLLMGAEQWDVLSLTHMPSWPSKAAELGAATWVFGSDFKLWVVSYRWETRWRSQTPGSSFSCGYVLVPTRKLLMKIEMTVAPVWQHVRCTSCTIVMEQSLFNGVCEKLLSSSFSGADKESYDSKFMKCL